MTTADFAPPTLRPGSANAESLAAEAIRLARCDARRARRLADEALSLADGMGDVKGASMAERAIGLVLREQYDVVGSARHLRRAIRIAERHGLEVCAAEARMSLLGTLALQGNWRGALREADRAEQTLQGVALARLRVQRATVLLDQGCLDDAMDGYHQALPELRRAGDLAWLARLFNNRGLTYLQKGAHAAAEADFQRAEKLHDQLGHRRSVAHARENLGLVACLRGDIPAALAYFDHVDASLDEQGLLDAETLNSRCLALLNARLAQEARAAGEAALRILTQQGREAPAAMARLLLAEAALLDGALDVAAQEARTARQAFVRQRRPTWAALAGAVALRASWLNGDRSPELVREAQRAARALAAAKFRIQAVDAEILGAEVALSCGRADVARRALARARRGRSGGPAPLRARLWHAEALLRLSDGNRRGAEAALQAGMRVVEQYRVTLGATELRAHASGHVTQLAQLGTRLAIERGQARRVLEWAERWRAGGLRLLPMAPPHDELLAAGLAQLRGVAAELDTAALNGRATDDLLRRQTELEERVRQRARHATAALPVALDRPPSAREVVEGLGDHALVEFVHDSEDLFAVVVAGRRARLHRLGGVADVLREVDSLRFSFRRLAHERGGERGLAAAHEAAVFGAKRLDGMLLAPLARAIDGRPLVVVPTSVLHAVPWAALATCQDRATTVAPSAAVWLRATRTAGVTTKGDVVFVAGPDLPHALQEVNDLARRYEGARRLTGRLARCDDVRASLDGARLAHVACHGRFRADNPMFSCIKLADGPLTVYDLERLERSPRTLVLSACDAGLSDVRPGDELMGLAAAVLSVGTSSLVASVFPVADEATHQLMLAFHERLRAGRTPAVALAEAQSRFRQGDPRTFAAAASFVCFGGGADSLG